VKRTGVYSNPRVGGVGEASGHGGVARVLLKQTAAGEPPGDDKEENEMRNGRAARRWARRRTKRGIDSLHGFDAQELKGRETTLQKAHVYGVRDRRLHDAPPAQPFGKVGVLPFALVHVPNGRPPFFSPNPAPE
jgi:hypothetical protein